MASKARDFVARFISDTARFAVDKVSRDLEDVGESSQEMDRELDRATDDAEASLRALDSQADRSAQGLDSSFDRIARSSRTNMAKVEQSSDTASRNVREDFGEMGGEIGEEAREGAASFDGSMQSIQDSAQAVAANVLTVFGPIGLAIGAAGAAAFGAMRARMERVTEAAGQMASAMIDSFTDVDAAAQGINDRLREMAEDGSINKLADDARAAKVPVEDFLLAVAGDPQAIDRVNKVLAEMDANNTKLGSGEAYSALKRVQDKMGEVGEAYTLAGEASELYADTASDTTDAVEDQAEELGTLRDAMDEVSGRTLTLRDAQRGYEESLDAANESLAENGKGLRVNTAEGRANAEALDGIARAAGDQAAAMDEAGASTDDVNGYLATARKALEDTAVRMGMSREEARKLAGQLVAIPDAVTVTYGSTGLAKVTAELNALKGLITTINGQPVRVSGTYSAGSAMTSWLTQQQQMQGGGYAGRRQ